MKKLLWLIGIGLFLGNGVALAQPNADSLEALNLTEINWQLDSLIPCYHYKPADSLDQLRSRLNVHNFPADSVPSWSDEVLRQRLKDIGSPISMDFNQYVRAYINMYTNSRREQVERMLGLSEIYFPIFEQEIDRMGLPMELKFLPVVESALNPHAVSRAGATGLWQFMLPTGRMYNLDVTSYVDERRDPDKATFAALRYLRNMYKTYGDWLLVIAAYNCGPGNVNKAIARSRGGRTFWEIRDNLPRETRGYVPAFIAAAYVFNYAADHNLYPKYTDFSFREDTVHFSRAKVSLKHLAQMTNTDFYLLKDLNPELKQDVIPYSKEPYVLRVPMRTGQHIALFRDSIFTAIAKLDPDSVKLNYADGKISPVTNRPYEKPSQKYTYSATKKGRTLVYHKVRSGEVVGSIASRYHVKAKDIQSWNRLRGYRIKAGQKLKIYVPDRYANSSKKTAPSKTTPQKTTPAPNGKGKYHTVRNGDTLWDIANAYDGLTVSKLKSLNSLKSNSLKVGQKLRVQ